MSSASFARIFRPLESPGDPRCRAARSASASSAGCTRPETSTTRARRRRARGTATWKASARSVSWRRGVCATSSPPRSRRTGAGAARTRATFGDVAASGCRAGGPQGVGEMSPRTLRLRAGAATARLPVVRRPEGAPRSRRTSSWRGSGGCGRPATRRTPSTTTGAPLHLVLGYAVRHGAHPRESGRPPHLRGAPEAGCRRRRVLDRHEMERLLERRPSATAWRSPARLFSGLRLSELLGLMWSDVDFRGRAPRPPPDGPRRQAPPLKTAAARATCPHVPARRELRRLRLASAFSPTGPRLLLRDGQTIGTATSPPAAWRRRGAADLEGVTFHVLRHTSRASSSPRATTPSSSPVSSATRTRRSR